MARLDSFIDSHIIPIYRSLRFSVRGSFAVAMLFEGGVSALRKASKAAFVAEEGILFGGKGANSPDEVYS